MERLRTFAVRTHRRPKAETPELTARELVEADRRRRAMVEDAVVTVLSADEDFFKPLHMEHVGDGCSSVLKFLALPPGWRFLVATDYEDVWFDPSLIGEVGST